MRIKFKEGVGGYKVTEIVDLNEAAAARLVKAKVAEYVDEQPPPTGQEIDWSNQPKPRRKVKQDVNP